jgi:response regulator RpfG family c-di-GMP phosphodiesterase
MFTILAVDDEPSILEITRWTLRRQYRVLTAGSGEEGLEVLAAQPVDLIVSDLRMPGMSGLEFLREARRLQPEALRVLATAYTTHEDTVRAVDEVGVYALLPKPWLPEELLGMLSEGLAGRSPR